MFVVRIPETTLQCRYTGESRTALRVTLCMTCIHNEVTRH